MPELQATIDAFCRGQATAEELHAAVSARLRAAPESASEIAALLDSARTQGLTREVHQALLADLRRHADATSSGITRDFAAPATNTTGLEGATSDADARAALTATGGFPALVSDGSPELGEGERLRGRFELISKLGEGGMGAVWKGKDLLKEEAKDRNPFVAIKLLQKNFKEHPDAFVALQRETAKQQRLAHPNVATVFSFDRDTDSGAVFMSMDLLEGESLDAVIRDLPEQGLDEEEAMSIIRQLAAGLAYAHQNGLVHSDLKPGNCFLTRDGTVKLLDFGIARASKTKADAEGVTTLFDPGELGAITPAYATVEMFEGLEPDPRDDIYALGIMAYQLFTGRHPYDKMSAPRARNQGLVPEPIAKLSKRQNRGLARALDLDRDKRTASVDQFIDDIGRKKRPVWAIAASVAAFALIAALAYAQITEYVRNEENEAIISVLKRGGLENIAAGLASIGALESDGQRRDILKDPRTREAVVDHIARGDRHSIREGLSLIRPFEPEWQQDVREDPRAREAIIPYYKQRIDAAFDPADGRYDYARARDTVVTLDSLYPNSARVLRLSNGLEQRRARELDRLTSLYDGLLEDLPSATAHEEGLGDVLKAIRLLDAENPTLKDPRLAPAFARQARAAMQQGNLTSAKVIMDLAAELLPRDSDLAGLREELSARLENQRQDRLAVALRARLESERGSLHTLEDFRRVQDDLILLERLRPRDSMLNDLRWQLQQLFLSDYDTLLAKQQWQEAEDLLLDFARYFAIPYVAEQRGRLDAALDDVDVHIPVTASRRSLLSIRAATVTELLRAPLLTPEWEIEFETAFKESLAMVGAKGSGVQLIGKTMMLLYRDRALQAVSAGEFISARTSIEKGRAYLPEAPELDAVERSLVSAQQSLLSNPQDARQDEKTAAAKAALLAHASGGRPDDATLALESIARDLAEDDPFIVEEARPAIAAAYRAQAEESRRAGDLEAAIAMLERAQALSPSDGVGEVLGRLRDEHAREQLTTALLTAVNAESALDSAALAAGIDEHARRYPGEHEGLMQELVALATARLISGSDPTTIDGPRLAGELDTITALFPGSANAISSDVTTAIEQRAAALASGDPFAAYDYVSSARIVLPNSAKLGALSNELPPRDIARVRRQMDAGQLQGAYDTLQSAKDRHPDRDEIARFEAELAARMARAREAYRRYVDGVKKRSLSKASQRRAAYADVTRRWSDNPQFQRVAYREPRPGECMPELAGRGREPVGVCYDLLTNGRRGMPLVVVPGGDGNAAAYAIGKYETSVAEFNLFCRQSGACEPLRGGNQQLPVTGVPKAAAEDYARWLSEQTSERVGEAIVYRLPTDQEWQHAAGGGGVRASRGINCRPTGKVDIASGLLTSREGKASLGLPVGRALVSVTFGEENGWGMVNPVGNAQEWVHTSAGLAARGGAYTDRVNRCRVAFSRRHDGSADERTGFRLLRELH